MADTKELNPEEVFIRRPIYAFDIPRDLLKSLALRSNQSSLLQIPTNLDQDQDVTAKGASGLSCAMCGVRSASVLDQRCHARSDVHRFNLKRRLRGEEVVTEAEFEKLVEGLSESISGSESSDSEDEENTATANDLLTTLLKKHTINNSEEHTSTERRAQGAGRPPLIWLKSPQLPENVSLGVYRALFPGIEADNEVLTFLNAQQIQPSTETPTATSAPSVFLCMMGGGHFAAMIVSLAPKLVKRHGVIEREAVVLAHKTFHRYTTRRKQGGSQSANDNAKGNAHSVGSNMRRYHEAALTAEIRELLEDWKEMLKNASLMFIRATGTQNRRALFGYEGAVLKSSDSRVRKLPFSTRRATQKELLRCFVELTRLKVSTIDPAQLEAPQPLAISSPAPKAPTPSKPKISKEEEVATAHSIALTALIRRSKAPALVNYLTTNKLSANFQLHPPNRHTPTLLHFASSLGQTACILSLLVKLEAGADPTVLNSDNKTAFELSADRPTRDTFRVARHELGNDRWDWSKAKVPPGISKKTADANLERERKDIEREITEEKKRRQDEFARLKQVEAEKEPSPITKLSAKAARPPGTGNKTLGGNTGSVLDATKGLSEEAVRKLERERRARAAEERIKAMMNKSAG